MGEHLAYYSYYVFGVSSGTITVQVFTLLECTILLRYMMEAIEKQGGTMTPIALGVSIIEPLKTGNQ